MDDWSDSRLQYIHWCRSYSCILSPSGKSRYLRLKRRKWEEEEAGRCSKRYKDGLRELWLVKGDELNYMDHREEE